MSRCGQTCVSMALLAVAQPYKWYDLCRLRGQPMRQLFIEADQVIYVDIAKVSLQQGIFSKLVSVIHVRVALVPVRGKKPHL